MKLTEARTKLRAILKKLWRKLKIKGQHLGTIFKEVFKDAVTAEFRYAVAILKEEGTKMIAELEDKVLDGDLKRSEWLDWAKAWLEEHAAEIKEEYGAEIRLPRRVLDMALTFLLNAHRNRSK